MMNLECKIVIIEDNDEFIDLYVEELKEHLEKKGFELSVLVISDVAEFKNKVHEFSNYSIFLVDLMFENKEHGVEFAKQIKKADSVSDVLFYSSERDFISKHRNNPVFDGVYFAERDSRNRTLIVDKAKELLDKQIRNANKSLIFRGTVLQYVSIFEIQLRKILSKLSNSFIEANPNFVRKFGHKVIKSKYTMFKKSHEYFFSNDILAGPKTKISDCVLHEDFSFANAIHETQIIDFDKIITTIESNITNKDVSGVCELYRRLNGIRNACAHQEAKRNQESNDLETLYDMKSDKLIVLDEETCTGIRKDILHLQKLTMKLMRDFEVN